MKFAHLADIHIGSWRDIKLKDLSTQAFSNATSICIRKEIDFLLISGDIFNTSIPPIDKLKETVCILKRLKSKNIPVYIIAGSHDFSPTGKTMIDVLEEADLLVNVCRGSVDNNGLSLKFTTDFKTGAKITGMIGKKGMLEKQYYTQLIKENLEKEKGFKIFLFHTALTELKPKEFENMDSAPISLLPKNFDYYAGGHVHVVKEANIDGYKNVIYPGPLFPNNFYELEKLKTGGFYLFDSEKGIPEFIPIKIYDIYCIELDCNHKTPLQVKSDLLDLIKKDDKGFDSTIVTIRIFGVLESGKCSDIDWNEIFSVLHEKSAFFVMKNTNKLFSKEFEEVKVQGGSYEEIEQMLIHENTQQITSLEPFGIKKDTEKELTNNLITALNTEKLEGETTADFETRIIESCEKVINNIISIQKK